MTRDKVKSKCVSANKQRHATKSTVHLFLLIMTEFQKLYRSGIQRGGGGERGSLRNTGLIEQEKV